MDVLLKQRLVGAIVLVALGVIFVPMILEGPARTLVPEMEALPEPGKQAPVRSLDTFPTPDAVPAEPEVSVLQADPEPVAEKPVPASGTEQPPVPQVDVAPEPAAPVKAEKTPVQPTAAPGPLGNWVVQMGSFSSEQNALRLRNRLRKAGFATQVEKVRVEGKPRFRVRVGPFLERSEAEDRRKRIQDKLSLKGRVLSYP
ncbi:MAG TPA: sporulation protein [Gammaproteobacteria bacterium]|nr:sporulation protein [Gammaproteobacteria bacterium]